MLHLFFSHLPLPVFSRIRSYSSIVFLALFNTFDKLDFYLLLVYPQHITKLIFYTCLPLPLFSKFIVLICVFSRSSTLILLVCILSLNSLTNSTLASLYILFLPLSILLSTCCRLQQTFLLTRII